ncbi:radical SAM protein [Candidatus Woesearchaeota archaeon]|nr:radical SAM protein [Candidatus Woesearchaeota archaeon]
MDEKTKQLIEKANKLTIDNFGKKTWFGRCIFLSWYCEVGTCKFCYRSTQKNRIQHASHAKRSLASMIVEALLAKNLGWHIEFLTGGYGIYPLEELVSITKIVSEVTDQKLWLNLGALKPDELKAFKPYVKGIVASIETIEPKLHDKICPNKPIEPYEQMFEAATDFKKSMTMVIGLGEKKEDFELLEAFIKKHKLERITFYALKPVPNTPYVEGPTTDDYAWWIAKTRLSFPLIQIIAGTTARRVSEVSTILKAGANAITKFPATKQFASQNAKILEEQIKKAGREFSGTLTKMPKIDWQKQIKELNIDNELKTEVKKTLKLYLDRMLP